MSESFDNVQIWSPNKINRIFENKFYYFVICKQFKADCRPAIINKLEGMIDILKANDSYNLEKVM